MQDEGFRIQDQLKQHLLIRELDSALYVHFDVTRHDRSVVRVWKLGDTRPVVLGRISELRPGARRIPVALWGQGRYLVEILGGEELELVDSLILDAAKRSEVTIVSPRHVAAGAGAN